MKSIQKHKKGIIQVKKRTLILLAILAVATLILEVNALHIGKPLLTQVNEAFVIPTTAE